MKHRQVSIFDEHIGTLVNLLEDNEYVQIRFNQLDEQIRFVTFALSLSVPGAKFDWFSILKIRVLQTMTGHSVGLRACRHGLRGRNSVAVLARVLSEWS